MLEYAHDRPITPEDLAPLMQQTSWMKDRTPEGILQMLQHSRVVSVWDGARLVGFGRAITDGVYRAFVEDIVVDDAYRQQGVGSALMKALLQSLQEVEEVQLGCEEARVAFYARLGFESSQQPKMILRPAKPGM